VLVIVDPFDFITGGSPKQVERLLPKLRESIPLLATLTPEMPAIVREESTAVELSQQYAITRVDYAGEEGWDSLQS
jgi:hypothetical protein